MQKGTTKDGIRWSVTQVNPRSFIVKVSNSNTSLSKEYKAQFPTGFGVDMLDVNYINEVLDYLIEKIRKKTKEEVNNEKASKR